MAAPRRTSRRGPGKRMVDGKSFRLADEVRYVQRCAAKHDGRIITIGQLILFSTQTGDAWLLDPTDRLAACVARDGEPEPVHIEEFVGVHRDQCVPVWPFDDLHWKVKGLT